MDTTEKTKQNHENAAQKKSAFSNFTDRPFQPKPKSPTLTAALRLAQWGANVMPVHGIVERDGELECTCEYWKRKEAEKFGESEYQKCATPGKHTVWRNWQNRATRDPKLIKEEWGGKKGARNIGVVCGKNTGLVGFDVDGERGFESLKALEAKFGPLPRTITVVTGSGGRHYWFRYPEGADIPNSAKALGAEAIGVESTNLDIRGNGGMLVGPPSRHKSGNYYAYLEGCSIDDIPFDQVPVMPDWLVKLCDDAKASNRNKAKGKADKSQSSPESNNPFDSAASDDSGLEAYLTKIGDHDGGEGFDRPIYQTALSYFARHGVDAPAGEIHSALKARILAAECKDGRNVSRYATDEYLSERIAKARVYIEANPPARREKSPTVFETLEDGFRVLNAKTAVVHVGGKTRFLKEGAKGGVDFQSEHDARITFAPYKLTVQKTKGRGANAVQVDEAVPLFPLWVQSNERREYAGVTFDPGEKTPQDGSSPDHVYNLWNGFAIEPAKPGVGSWRLMQRHVFNVICNSDEAQFIWTCAWFADILQNPASKPGSSIVAIGEHGSGKSIVAEAFARILGKHYTYVDDERGLTGNFNAHFETALLVDVAEAYFSGNMKLIGKVKSLITAPTMPFERKGIDPVQVPSYARFYQTANPNKENKVIFAEEGERRYFVTEVGEQHAKDPNYFRPLVAEKNGDGPAAMLRDLLALDIRDVDLTNPPLTAAFGEQVAVNMSQKEKWWMGILYAGQFPIEEFESIQNMPTPEELDRWQTEGLIIEKEAVFASYNSRVRPYGGGKTDARTIGKDLREMVPGLTECRPKRAHGDRARCFVFPPLKTLRDDFTARTQIRLGGEVEAKVTKADLQDPFFAAGYEVFADAVIDGVFGREVSGLDSDDGDSDGPYVAALQSFDGATYPDRLRSR